MIRPMERFDASIKTEFPEHNTPVDIEVALAVMHRLKLPECDGIGLSPVSKVPAQMMILTQVALRRTIELTEAAIREINRRNLITSALLARGTMETSCLLWDVMFKVEELVKLNDTGRMKGFHELMSKSLFGGKAKDVRIIDEVEARNVITIIERLSKKLDVPLMGYFERLSEFAHPNYHGMMATYTVEGADAGFKAFCDRRKTTERPLILTALGTIAVSANVTVRCFEMVAKDLVGLAELAEREIHEGGTWPKDEPYPVQRS
jgi:hypothetical protein